MKTPIEKKIQEAAWELVFEVYNMNKAGTIPDELGRKTKALEKLLADAIVTKVIFRKFKQGGDIIALFPEIPGTNSPKTCQNYMHIGQHGHGSADCGATVPAKRAEYMPLKKELESLGYNLEVVSKFCSHHRAARVKELNRKYGA